MNSRWDLTTWVLNAGVQVETAPAWSKEADRPTHTHPPPVPSGNIIYKAGNNFHNSKNRLASFERKEKQKKETGL